MEELKEQYIIHLLNENIYYTGEYDYIGNREYLESFCSSYLYYATLFASKEEALETIKGYKCGQMVEILCIYY